jgi:hypothetical protein
MPKSDFYWEMAAFEITKLVKGNATRKTIYQI